MKALTLSLLLTADSSHAALVYSGIKDIPVPTTFGGVSIDLINSTFFNGDPATDWSDSQVNFFFGGDGIFSGPRFLPVREDSQATSPIVNLSGGEVVDDSSVFGPVGNGASDSQIGTGSGQFASGTEGYLGFQLDLTGSGDFVNGFMRVTLTNGSSEGTVHDWTYSDTPGEPVIVGVIPESSTFTLLGLFGLTFLSWRRRSLLS